MLNRKLLLVFVSFVFITFLFGCRQRDMVVNITPASSATESQQNTSSATVRSETQSSRTSRNHAVSSATRSGKYVSDHSDTDSEKTDLKVQLNLLNSYFEQYKKQYAQKSKEQAENISSLKKQIAEEESYRDDMQKKLDLLRYKTIDGTAQAEKELEQSIGESDLLLVDLQKKLDEALQQQDSLDKDFAATERNYLYYKASLQEKITLLH